MSGGASSAKIEVVQRARTAVRQYVHGVEVWEVLALLQASGQPRNDFHPQSAQSAAGQTGGLGETVWSHQSQADTGMQRI